jgi:hypothetical protein
MRCLDTGEEAEVGRRKMASVTTIRRGVESSSSETTAPEAAEAASEVSEVAEAI